MKKEILLIAGAACALLFHGCETPNAEYIDPGGERSLISTDRINIRDWNNAATSLVGDLFSSGRLAPYQPKPVKMKVSRVTNRTSEAVDTELLTKQITMALNNSGDVRAISDDEYTKELAEIAAMRQNKGVDLPKLTLTGRITELRESVGSRTEVTYVFMLTLNADDGAAIWEGQKQISKQQSKSSWGF